jgi:hypothetical protein
VPAYKVDVADGSRQKMTSSHACVAARIANTDDHNGPPRKKEKEGEREREREREVSALRHATNKGPSLTLARRLGPKTSKHPRRLRTKKN